MSGCNENSEGVRELSSDCKRMRHVRTYETEERKTKRRKQNAERQKYVRSSMSDSERHEVKGNNLARVRSLRFLKAASKIVVRESLWKKINQGYETFSVEERNAFEALMEDYDYDLERFHRKIFPRLEHEDCGVCGVLCDEGSKRVTRNDDLFKPLVEASRKLELKQWLGYSRDNTLEVCAKCLTVLQNKKCVPRFSRINIPIPDSVDVLNNLTDLEQMLISPLLPMVYIWRKQGYWQYQHKGKCVAFVNDVQRLASKLPRHPAEVIINLKGVYGNQNISINASNLRKALIFLKRNHPGYKNIEIAEEVLDEIQASPYYSNQNKNVGNSATTASEYFTSQGQKQQLEEEVALRSLSNPVTLDTKDSSSDVKNAILDIFKGLANKSSTLCDPGMLSQNWALLFPCILWNGNGGPQGLLSSITLREWVSYVVKIGSLPFHRNIIFICFCHVYFRRRKITNITTFKPISSAIRSAVEQLLFYKQQGKSESIPEYTLSSLINKLSLHVTNLPGSLQDMKMFRNDLLSMMSRLGPPSIFCTISAADSIWPDIFYEILNGQMSIENIKRLSAKQRADLCAENPVKMTLAWKRRKEAFLNLLLHGKSKPFGEISHYAYKAEWQGHLSEHAHFLFWLKKPIPKLEVNEYGELIGLQEKIIEKSESLATAIIPEYYSERVSKGNDVSPEQLMLSHPTTILKGNLHDVIQKEPVSLRNFLSDTTFSKEIEALVKACQIHIHSTYCTKKDIKPLSSCKSHFPFPVKDQSEVKKLTDERGNTSYRIKLRRNHPYVNNYNAALLNLWRANMDVSILSGGAFSSIIYVTLYTSKIDKTAEIREVLGKLKPQDQESDMNKKLRNILMNLDTCRCIGAPEAASNLMMYPYYETSVNVLRLDTRIYSNTSHPKNEDKEFYSLNDILYELTSENQNFHLLPSSNSSNMKVNKIASDYFNRPSQLFNINQFDIIDADNMSMVQYIEGYRITKKRKKNKYNQSVDKKGKIIEPRETNKQKVILDLKYRVSPPDSMNPHWCAGALALHVPHRSVKDLLTVNDKQVSLTDAFDYYSTQLKTPCRDQIIDNEGEPYNNNDNFLYPELQQYRKDEYDLYNATKQTKSPETISIRNEINTSDFDSSVNTTNDCNVDQPFSNDDILMNTLNETDNSLRKGIKWNGMPLSTEDIQLSPSFSNIPLEGFIHNKENVSRVPHSKNEEEHRTFLSKVLKREIPNVKELETDQQPLLLKYCEGNRKKLEICIFRIHWKSAKRKDKRMP